LTAQTHMHAMSVAQPHVEPRRFTVAAIVGVIGIHTIAQRYRLSRTIKRRCYPLTRLVLGGMLAVSACMAMSGCYLLESAYGQLSLLSKREPIERVIARPSTPEAVRLKLEEVADIRRFASHDLGLPEDGSYRSYARISRNYVVWAVVAAPEFSIDPRLWCYPIVGCVAYRGYFVERKARAFAAHWSKKGFDVTIDGVAAYSTLGHFDDPIISTMINWSDTDLAAVIFHELTHQMLYVANDADFDEALAMTVQEEGVRRWLTLQGRESELAAREVDEDHQRQAVELLRHTRDQLRILYASGGTLRTMREEKRATLAALQVSYEVLKKQWGGAGPFDSWFDDGINNAKLASIATYYDCIPGLQRELAAVNGDLAAFYRRAFELSKLSRSGRHAVLCETTNDRVQQPGM